MIGTSLGHYRIVAELGRGGMGIVYRAEDTRLERTVAIKVLPANALLNEEDRARFYREAKAAAQLNHPHIAAIHQIDEAVPEGSPPGTGPSPFIAMEFIDGQPLDARIREKPLPLKEAVDIATDVASALQAAHEKQIVHRDIKSANVMLTAKGEPKVLDFGLAKTTHSTMLTRMGSTMGTVAYMSPEQARGETVDARTDLWSLGIMLYEMVAGRVPFATDYEQAAVYSILNEDPEPLTSLRTGVPMELERIVTKLLAKDGRLRYQTAADLIADLGALDLSPSAARTVRTTSTPSTSHTRFSGRTRISALLLGGLILVVAGWWLGSKGSAAPLDHGFARFTSVALPGLSEVSHPTLSPDGRFLVFTSARSTLWLYDFSDGSLKTLDAEGDVRVSTFSPDGRWLAYEARGSNIHLAQIPEGITSLAVSGAVLPEWIDSEWLLVSDGSESGFDRYNRITGERRDLYRPASESLNVSHADVLPGGREALVSIMSSPRSVGLLDLEDGSLKTLVTDAFAPRYLASGHLVFTRQAGGVTSFEGEVYAQPFDLSSGRVLGQPVKVLDRRGFWEYSVNQQGDLATSAPLRQPADDAERDLGILDLESGATKGTSIQLPLSSGFVQITHDEEWLMYVDFSDDQLMFGRLADRRFVPVPNVVKPLWNALLSDDDETVHYTSGQVGAGLTVYRQPLDGSRAPEKMDFGLGRHEILMDVRGDDYLVRVFGSVGAQSGLYHIDAQSGEKRLIVEGDAESASYSPDGRWVAWHQNDTDGVGEVWIAGIQGEGPWPIARYWGYPRWNDESNGLYFYVDNTAFYTDIAFDRGVRATGAVKTIREFEGNPSYTIRRGLDVTAYVDNARDETVTAPSMDVVLGWSARLKELAPRN